MKYIKEDGGKTIKISEHVGEKVIVSFLFLSGLVYSWVFAYGIYESFYNNGDSSDQIGSLFCMVLGLVFIFATLFMFYKLITKFEVTIDKKNQKLLSKQNQL